MTGFKSLVRQTQYLGMALILLPVAVAVGQDATKLQPVGKQAYRILSAFYDYDRNIPLAARVVEKKDTKTSIRWKVVFRSARSFLVPGYLEFPKRTTSPCPCVLLLHGWSGSKENWWQEKNYISGNEVRQALLEKGYAVFALDAQGHGDRIAENDYQVVNLYHEPGTARRENYFTLREIVVQTVIDYRRGMDYLAMRGDIDMARIGLLGYSMGGFQSVPLTAVDTRIKVAAGCVVPVSWQHDPVLAPENYVRGIGLRPFAMFMGRTDPLCKEAQARQLYALIKNPKTAIYFYDSGHRLPADYVNEAVTWIAKHL